MLAIVIEPTCVRGPETEDSYNYSVMFFSCFLKKCLSLMTFYYTSNRRTCAEITFDLFLIYNYSSNYKLQLHVHVYKYTKVVLIRGERSNSKEY